MKPEDLRLGATYKHYKGGLYVPFALALDTSMGRGDALMVVYRAWSSVPTTERVPIFVRRFDEWDGPVGGSKSPQTQRFELVPA